MRGRRSAAGTLADVSTDATRGYRAATATVASLPPDAVLAAAGALLERAIAGEADTLAATFAQTTLVIGSAQKEASVDRPACERDGIPVIRRGSGGGAVLCDPGLLEVDVALPAGHALLCDDVTESYRFLGQAWIDALGKIGVDGRLVTVGEARNLSDPRRAAARIACYAGLSPYEVVDPEGRKLVGLCQRRRRGAALFQCSLACGLEPAAVTRYVHVDASQLAATRSVERSPDAVWAALEPLLAV
jgi:lipoate-protein ligase A